MMVCLTLSCSSVKTGTPSINVLSQPAPGEVLVEVDGVGSNRAKAEYSAKEMVLTRLLYQGIPNASVTAVRLPMIENQNTLTGKQKSAIKKLLAADSINQYFNSLTTTEERPTRATGSGRMQRFTARVNYDLFRKHLEQAGVIRKFGY